MGYGATGRILRVDLTRMRCHTEQMDEDVYRLYPGGKALAGYFLLREFLSDLGSIYLLILGALAITIMLLAPKGIWGYVAAQHVAAADRAN